MIRSTSPSAVASSASCSCPPPESSETDAAGSSAAASASPSSPARKAFELSALLEPAQHGGVAALQAEGGSIDRHVRAAPRRRPPPRRSEPASWRPRARSRASSPRPPRRPDPAARRSRARPWPSRRSRASVSASRSSRASLSPSSRPASTSARLASSSPSTLASIRSGQIPQAGVLLIPADTSQLMRGILRLAADLLNGLGSSGHAQRVTGPRSGSSRASRRVPRAECS